MQNARCKMMCWKPDPRGTWVETASLLTENLREKFFYKHGHPRSQNGSQRQHDEEQTYLPGVLILGSSPLHTCTEQHGLWDLNGINCQALHWYQMSFKQIHVSRKGMVLRSGVWYGKGSIIVVTERVTEVIFFDCLIAALDNF